MSEKIKVKRWLKAGELDPTIFEQDDILENCGNLLDASCSHEILGDVMFEGTDGKFYTITVEAVISEANPDFVKEALEDLKDEEI
jgi:hypothetical protein